MTVKLVIMPSVSLGDFPLDLPTPTASNCGGYILPSASGTVYAYSPIDLCVAAIEAKRRDMIVTDLAKFFHLNKVMLSIHSVHIGVEMNSILCVDSVAAFKTMCAFDNGLSAMLHHNAPLTF